MWVARLAFVKAGASVAGILETRPAFRFLGGYHFPSAGSVKTSSEPCVAQSCLCRRRAPGCSLSFSFAFSVKNSDGFYLSGIWIGKAALGPWTSPVRHSHQAAIGQAIHSCGLWSRSSLHANSGQRDLYFDVLVTGDCPCLPAELYPTQPLSEPLLHQSPPLPGGAWEGLLLANRPHLGSQACGTGVPKTETEGCLLLPHPLRASVLTVSPLLSLSA